MSRYFDLEKQFTDTEGLSVYRLPKLGGSVSVTWDKEIDGILTVGSHIIYRGKGDSCPSIRTTFLWEDVQVSLPPSTHPVVVVDRDTYALVDRAYELTRNWYDHKARLLYSDGRISKLTDDSSARNLLRDAVLNWYYLVDDIVKDVADSEAKRHLTVARDEFLEAAKHL